MQELTDEQMHEMFHNHDGQFIDFCRAIIEADRELQAARHAEELEAYALTVSNRDAEIANLRAQREPVAWGMPDACGNIVEAVTADEVGQAGELRAWRAQYSVPLYTAAPAPEPERKPMTEIEAFNLWATCKNSSSQISFKAGVRAAEAHHGIAPPEDK